jgi:hypothetical protein
MVCEGNLSFGRSVLTQDRYLAAEWAIAGLQAKPAFQSDQMRSTAAGHNNQNSTPEDNAFPSDTTGSTAPDLESPARVIGQYHCSSRSRHGNLTVTTQSVDFNKQHLTRDRSWRLRSR